jgi:acetyl/propionyl-CoA carboxylase alpha subunit
MSIALAEIADVQTNGHHACVGRRSFRGDLRVSGLQGPNDSEGDFRLAQPSANGLHHCGCDATMQQRLEAVGSAGAENGAGLSAQVSGIVKAIHFQSGAKVEKGTLLVELEAADDIAHVEALKAMEALAATQL